MIIPVWVAVLGSTCDCLKNGHIVAIRSHFIWCLLVELQNPVIIDVANVSIVCNKSHALPNYSICIRFTSLTVEQKLILFPGEIIHHTNMKFKWYYLESMIYNFAKNFKGYYLFIVTSKIKTEMIISSTIVLLVACYWLCNVVYAAHVAELAVGCASVWWAHVWRWGSAECFIGCPCRRKYWY